MNITYKNIKNFEDEQLQSLFLSVKWESGNYPEKLRRAMENSHRVISAWQEDELIGLINCLSDGSMTSFFPYLLVKPAYQGKGIGRCLLSMMLQECREHLRSTLVAYDSAVEFYKSCGLSVTEGTRPMSITNRVS